MEKMKKEEYINLGIFADAFYRIVADAEGTGVFFHVGRERFAASVIPLTRLVDLISQNPPRDKILFHPVAGGEEAHHRLEGAAALLGGGIKG